MSNDELVNYWLKAAELDFQSMHNLGKANENHWALFIGQLVLEKTLKAIYVQNVDNQVPRTHNLVQLAISAGLELSEDIAEKLDLVTSFNINTRYPDDKFGFYKKCTKEFTNRQISIIEELYKWLLSQVKKK